MINFQLISKNDPEKLMYYYGKAYSWDKDKVCFLMEKEELKLLAMQLDSYIMKEGSRLIGFATSANIQDNIEYKIIIDKFVPKIETKLNKVAEVATIIRPNYRGLGYGSKLLESLLEVTKLKYESAIACILLENNASIALYKSFDFRYRCTCDDLNFYEKKLRI